MISFAKKHHELIVNILVLLMIISFLFSYFKPSLLFLDTTTTGGDMPGHNVLAHYLKTDLLPNGKLIGWFPYSLSGFPLFQYYFFLPYFIAALLSYLMPFNIAFKVSTVLGIFLLPIAVFISTKLIGFRFPAPAIASIFSLLFLFKEEGFAAGGTIKSALAGQFSFTLSLVFLFIALGAIYRGIERQYDRKYFIVSVFAIALIVFSHIFSMIPFILICSFFIIEALIKKSPDNVLYLAKVFGLAFLLTGFWSIPYIFKKDWTMLLLGYNQIGLINLDFLVSKFFLPFLIAALLAVILSKFKRAYLYTFYWFLIVNIFLFAFNASLLHSRFFNVLYLFILISASGFFSVFSKWLKAKWLLPIIVFFIVAGSIHSTNTTAAEWIKWNYEGVENKNTYSTYQKINDFFLNKDFSGRIDFEYYNYNNLGSPRIFELSPLFHKKPVMEGLLFESTLTYPFFFYIQREVSEAAWWPGFDIRIPTQNMTKGMKEFWLFNVKYFVARSNKTKALLEGNQGYALEKEISEFSIYRINQKSQYVEVLKKEPILFVTDDWKKYALDWMGSDERETFFVFTKNLKPDDTHLFDIIVSEKPVMGKNKKIFGANQIESALSQSENIKRECRIEETVENQRISFKTSCVGLPHLIKMSYYPNWKVKGAKKVYLISPVMMMVIPERADVELYYGATFSDMIGITASIIAFIFIAVLAFKPGLLINKKTERIKNRLRV